jgi:hypothetical protein
MGRAISDRAATGDRWCILRTTGGRTIRLARSLDEAGIEAWTPIHTTTRRRPRSKVVVEQDAPIAPTFVFARACHLAELARMRLLPLSPHPAFSVFSHGGRVPLVSDSEIIGLRAAEDKAKRKVQQNKRRSFVIGQSVKMEDGSFAGMTGVIEEDHGRYALVSFGGTMRVKIDSWLLPEPALL